MGEVMTCTWGIVTPKIILHPDKTTKWQQEFILHLNLCFVEHSTKEEGGRKRVTGEWQAAGPFMHKPWSPLQANNKTGQERRLEWLRQNGHFSIRTFDKSVIKNKTKAIQNTFLTFTCRKQQNKSTKQTNKQKETKQSEVNKKVSHVSFLDVQPGEASAKSKWLLPIKLISC